MSRTIVHLDADAFFASVEQAADTRLMGKPIAVGGESRGIIASASYEARKFGVYTPMPTARARKLCPKLIVLPGDYERYAGGLDRHGGNGIVRTNLQKLRAGDRAVSGIGCHCDGGAIRKWARLFVARVAGGKTAHEIGSQAIAASSDCRAGLVTHQRP